MANDYTKIDFETVVAQDEMKYLYRGGGFIATPQYGLLFKKNYSLFVSRKGGGKSALALSTVELNQTMRHITDMITLTPKEFSLKNFMTHVSEIAEKMHIERVHVISNIWRWTICVRLMLAIRRVVTRGEVEQSADFYVIRDYLEQLGLTGKKRFPLRYAAGYASDLVDEYLQTHHHTEAVSGFPTDESFEEAEASMKRVIEHFEATNYGRAVVVVDEIDPLVEECGYDLTVEFLRGLLMATKSVCGLMRDYPCFHIYLFVPMDLYNKTNYRHSDKEIASREVLAWDPETLKLLIAKRIAEGVKMRNVATVDQDRAFSRIFKDWPHERIRVTDYWGRDMDVFEYIWFHSQMNPREVLNIFYHITKHAAGHPYLTKSDVIRGVDCASEFWIKIIINEYHIRVPHLEDLLASFAEKNNVLSVDECHRIVINRLRAIYGDDKIIDSTEVLNDLYELGFLGLVVPPEKPADNFGATSGRRDSYENVLYSSTSYECVMAGDVMIHPLFWKRYRIRCDQTRPIRRLVYPRWYPFGSDRKAG